MSITAVVVSFLISTVILFISMVPMFIKEKKKH